MFQTARKKSRERDDAGVWIDRAGNGLEISGGR